MWIYVLYNIYDIWYIIYILLKCSLALIRLRFIELGFRQIKRKYIQYNTMYWSIYNRFIKFLTLFIFDSFIYRAVRSTLIKLVVFIKNYAAFGSIYYDVAMFIGYIVCFFVKLTFNFICSWFVTLYIASSHFSVTYEFYGFIHDLFLHSKYALARSSRITCEHCLKFMSHGIYHI